MLAFLRSAPCRFSPCRVAFARSARAWLDRDWPQPGLAHGRRAAVEALGRGEGIELEFAAPLLAGGVVVVSGGVEAGVCFALPCPTSATGGVCLGQRGGRGVFRAVVHDEHCRERRGSE